MKLKFLDPNQCVVTDVYVNNSFEEFKYWVDSGTSEVELYAGFLASEICEDIVGSVKFYYEDRSGRYDLESIITEYQIGGSRNCD